jgi:hypothetical protein
MIFNSIPPRTNLPIFQNLFIFQQIKFLSLFAKDASVASDHDLRLYSSSSIATLLSHATGRVTYFAVLTVQRRMRKN